MLGGITWHRPKGRGVESTVTRPPRMHPSGILRLWSGLCALMAGLLIVGCLDGSLAMAQVRTGYPEERGLKPTDFPRVIKLADSVYGYEDLRAPGFTTVSFFVVGGDGVLLADGQESPAAMQRLLGTIAKITPKPIKWYVVGSDHADHTGGNSLLPHDVRYIVHPTSKWQLERDAVAAANNPSIYPVIVPPEAMRSDHETIDIGGRKVEVMFLGRAHTGGDLMVYLPSDKILFMSEVYFNRVFPAMRAAYPTEWLHVIDEALQMDVQRYVPAHGFIEEAGISRVQLVEFRGAVDYVAAEARRLHDLGLSPEEALKQANWGSYGSWMLADSQRLIAIKRVFSELNGDLR